MIDVIGYSAGILAMVTFCPQLIKTLHTKKAGDISVLMLLLTLATNVLYLIYGILLKLYPIVIMLGIMSCTVLMQIVLTMKYSKDTYMANQANAADAKTRAAD